MRRTARISLRENQSAKAHGEEMTDVDHLGGVALDLRPSPKFHRYFRQPSICSCFLDDIDDLVDHEPHRAPGRRRTPKSTASPVLWTLTPGHLHQRHQLLAVLAPCSGPLESSILSVAISSSRVTSPSGTALGWFEPARKTSSEVSCSPEAAWRCGILVADAMVNRSGGAERFGNAIGVDDHDNQRHRPKMVLPENISM